MCTKLRFKFSFSKRIFLFYGFVCTWAKVRRQLTRISSFLPLWVLGSDLSLRSMVSDHFTNWPSHRPWHLISGQGSWMLLLKRFILGHFTTREPKTKSHCTLKTVSKFLLMYLELLIWCTLNSKNQIHRKNWICIKTNILSLQLFYFQCVF